MILRALALAVAALAFGAQARAADLTPPNGPSAVPSPPWRFAGLPAQTKPATHFDIVTLDGLRVLRIEADQSYGNLLHPLAAGSAAGTLSWRAQVARPLQGVDLTTRRGDDAALRVCALFDMPVEQVPLFERTLLRLARSRSDEPLPTATLCYVWDAALPPGSVVVSPYTRRVRSIVVHSPPGQWQTERHDLGNDFLRVFGDEASRVPTVAAILIGADADNTASHSVAHVSEIHHSAP